MIACTKCDSGIEDGVEFCANPSYGAYLGYVGEKVQARPGSVTVAMTPTMIKVQPGAAAVSEIRVRNRTNIVEQHEVRVVGGRAVDGMPCSARRTSSLLR